MLIDDSQEDEIPEIIRVDYIVNIFDVKLYNWKTHSKITSFI